MIQFVKMHALGNDFMLLDARNQAVTLTAAHIKALADRHSGVGFDQLLYLEASNNDKQDAIYRIFNADGQEVGQCGNGARCVAHYLYLQGKAKHEPVVLSSQAGLITVTCDAQHDVLSNEPSCYRAALAIPTFSAAQIPLNTQLIDNHVATLAHGLLTWSYLSERYQGGVVNVGNPHWVIPMPFEHIEDKLKYLGEALQVEDGDSHQSLFPEGVNVTWMQIQNKHEVRIETYERGVGLTRACGSAAAATAVVAISQGWCDNPVRVNVADGYLMVEWGGNDTPVFVTGPAVLVYYGQLAVLPAIPFVLDFGSS